MQVWWRRTQNCSSYISKIVTGVEFQGEQIPWLEARVAAPTDFEAIMKHK